MPVSILETLAVLSIQGALLPAGPCTEWGGATAPLNSASILCGIEMTQTDLLMDGQRVGNALPVPDSMSEEDDPHPGQLHVMRHGDYALVSVTRDIWENAAMIRRSGEPTKIDAFCGRYGIGRVFGFSPDGRYAVAATNAEGSYLICRMDFQTMRQTEDWIEDAQYAVEDLSIEWQGHDFMLLTPDGDPAFRF